MCNISGIVTIVAGVVLSGCASILGFGFQQPEITLDKISVQGVSNGSVALDVLLLVKNNNDSSIRVQSLQYEIAIGSEPIAKGAIAQPFEIPGNKTEKIKAPIQVDPSSTMRIFTQLYDEKKNAKDLVATVVCDAKFGTGLGTWSHRFVSEKKLSSLKL